MEKDENLMFVLALYEDGSWQRYRDCKEGYVMLVDLGRGRNTIMSNPESTFNAEFQFGHYWEKSSEHLTGDYVIVDDDYVVHMSIKATNNDFNMLKDRYYHGLILCHERGFTYYDKDGKFYNI